MSGIKIGIQHQTEDLIMMINIVKVCETAEFKPCPPPRYMRSPWGPPPLLACFIRATQRQFLPVIYFSPSSLSHRQENLPTSLFQYYATFSPSIEGIDGAQADLCPSPLDIQDGKQAH